MKKALITGANKGVGFETARQLLENGYYVFIGSRNKENGKLAVQQLQDAGIKKRRDHSIGCHRQWICRKSEIRDRKQDRCIGRTYQ